MDSGSSMAGREQEVPLLGGQQAQSQPKVVSAASRSSLAGREQEAPLLGGQQAQSQPKAGPAAAARGGERGAADSSRNGGGSIHKAEINTGRLWVEIVCFDTIDIFERLDLKDIKVFLKLNVPIKITIF